MATITKAQKRDSILTDERVIQLFRVQAERWYTKPVVQTVAVWVGAVVVILGVGHLPAP